MASVTLDEKQQQESRSPSPGERAAEAAASEVIASPDQLPFDRVSRQRLLVAQVAAETIERLVETGAWERLESAVAESIVQQARRLETYVATLAQARPVRTSEPALLLLRRLERRLAISVELVESGAQQAGAAPPAGLFLGDFTEVEVEVEPAVEAEAVPGQAPFRKSKAAPPRQQAKSRGKARGRWASHAEKLGALRQSKRFTGYVAVALIAVAASVLALAVTTLQERSMLSVPPPVAFKPDDQLKDVKVFVPAAATMSQGNDLAVVVSREWLMRPADRRVADANGLSVYLLNRNVRRLRLQWEDGRPIVQYENGTPTWFTEPVAAPAPSRRSPGQ